MAPGDLVATHFARTVTAGRANLNLLEHARSQVLVAFEGGHGEIRGFPRRRNLNHLDLNMPTG